MSARAAGGHRFPRVYRVNEVLREVLADELEKLSDADDRLGIITVTGVTAEPDLRHATVFLSSLDDEAADALAAHRGALQAAIGRQVRLKRTPRLSFAVDPGVVQGAVVDDVLRRLHDSGAMDDAGGTTDPDGAGGTPDGGAGAGPDDGEGSTS